ncbi:DUF3152 domain-containing protein [Tsukamurella sp. 1534]|uniref:DUF3152 domain-containing protein n=1 Tax=Tsukamurella sp. 1534 TaxID=1151061 RepID=UPI00030F7CCA|nr:DUF3152 domain-containing protein [Tsukamurella sp. 1534]
MSSPSSPRRPRPDGRAPLRAEWDPINPSGGASGDGRNRPPRERKYPKQSALTRILNTYGWRAYAVPVLAVLTILALVFTFWGNPFGADKASDTVTENPLSRNPNPEKTIVGARRAAGPVPQAGMLPNGGPFTEKGQGIWHVVPGATGQVGEGKQHVYTYQVAVEDGVDMGALGGDQTFATMIDRTLGDPRSWIHDPAIGFRRVDGDTKPDFTISLSSPITTRSACGYQIQLESSCYNGEFGRVVINLARWSRGANAFEGDLTGYRQYAINHEVGHAIGYPQHVPCPSNGGLAPIMMQQTFGVNNRDIFNLDKSDGFDNDLTCRPNAWVAPVLR